MFFQKLKIELLREEFVAENVRKVFFRNIKIKNSTFKKIAFFELLQFLLTKFFYLIYVDFKKKLFIDFDFSKEFDFVDMIYYIKKFVNWNGKNYSSRKTIEFILFLNRLLIDVETKYWFTKLKLASIVWILKKVRYIIDFFEQSFTVIFTNHSAALNIVKQINITIAFINKLNFHLVRAFDYIQRFNVKLRHKFEKQHIVSNVFFRFVSINIDTTLNEKKLNALFTVVLVEIKKNFRRKLVANYVNNSHWKKISTMFD